MNLSFVSILFVIILYIAQLNVLKSTTFLQIIEYFIFMHSIKIVLKENLNKLEIL